jgi:hypothetical protein
MTLFDKICAVMSFLLGVLLLLLGVAGLFMGCNAHFTLPPVFGVLPAFVGWGIVRPIIIAWRGSGDAYAGPPRSLAQVGSPLSSMPPAAPQQERRAI